MFLHQHLNLLERDRSFALRAALTKAVQPGSTVLDAGTGSGVLATWAAMAGAARVVAVDLEHSAVAEQLARDNGVGDRVEVRAGDLRTLNLDGRFDVVTALVYMNDPRRDEARSQLVFDLLDRFGRGDTTVLPDRVRYRAQVLAWPAQDLASWRIGLDERVRTLGLQHGTDFSVFRRQLHRDVPLERFPDRGPDGRVRRDGARALGTPVDVIDIRYTQAAADGTRERTRYPSAIRLPIDRPGVADVVLWTQELLWGEVLLFRNESVSWLASPRPVDSGTHLVAQLDDGWRATNVVESVELG